MSYSRSDKQRITNPLVGCGRALAGAGHAYDVGAQPPSPPDLRQVVDVGSTPPQIDREKNALEQEVIGPLPIRSCSCCSVSYVAVITPSRPRGQPYCRLCHGLINARWRANHRISRTAPSVVADGRRTGANAKTLCAAATDAD